MRFLFFLLPLASFALRLLSLAQTPFANGWDAYFYLIQIKSLEETGCMHSPEASLVYPVLWGLYKLTGHYVFAYKLGAALFAGGFTAAVMAAGHRIAGARAALLLGAWTLCSGHLSYFAAQYPKNLLGMILLVSFIAVLVGEKPKWAAAAGLLVLGYFGHRFTFGLALVFGGLWLLFRYGEKPLSLLSNRKFRIAGGILFMSLLLAALFFPGLLHWSDWQRLSGHFSASPQWPPWSFYTSFGPDRIGYWWRTEIVIACLVLLWACLQAVLHWRRAIRQAQAAQHPPIRNTAPAVSLLLLSALLLFPFLEWSLTGLSFRAFLVFVLLFPLLLLVNLGPLRGLKSLGMRLLQSPPPPPISSSPPVSSRYSNLLPSATLITLATFTPLATFTYRPSLHDPNYALYQSVTKSALARLGAPGRPDLVIAPNAFAEFFTFHTGIDAMPWLPEYAIAPERLWRIASGVREPALRHYAPSDSLGPVYSLPGRYLLLQERRWQSAIRTAGMAGDTAFVHACRSWPNPSSVRPAFLLRRKVRKVIESERVIKGH